MKKLLAASLILFALISCATWKNTARLSVVALIDSWEITMTSLGEMYKAGSLTEEQKGTAIKYGELVRKGLLTAATAIDTGDSFQAGLQIKNVTDALAKLKELFTNRHSGGNSAYNNGYPGSVSSLGEVSSVSRRYREFSERGGNFRRFVEGEVSKVTEKQRRIFRERGLLSASQ